MWKNNKVFQSNVDEFLKEMSMENVCCWKTRMDLKNWQWQSIVRKYVKGSTHFFVVWLLSVANYLHGTKKTDHMLCLQMAWRFDLKM
jgi:hypothetical protein